MYKENSTFKYENCKLCLVEQLSWSQWQSGMWGGGLVWLSSTTNITFRRTRSSDKAFPPLTTMTFGPIQINYNKLVVPPIPHLRDSLPIPTMHTLHHTKVKHSYSESYNHTWEQTTQWNNYEQPYTRKYILYYMPAWRHTYACLWVSNTHIHT